MSSSFSERLDFLMRVTNTSNSSLARALAFDASYISRIRKGKRGIPLRQPFVGPASTYLAARIREPYQLQAVEQALHMQGRWPKDNGSAATLLEAWLDGKDARLNLSFERFFESFPGQGQASTPPPVPSSTPEDFAKETIATPISCYFGKEGKRHAVIQFLSRLAEDGKPHTLLLYSDENMEWLTEDPAFSYRWASLLLQVLENGGRITIIHTITREIGEMLEAVQKWLPMYLTGGIESYYCPRLRDGICRRTLFVAQGEMAITSNSIENNLGAAMSQLSSDPHVVQATEGEFANLLSLCRPLVTTASAAGILLNGRISDEDASSTLFASEDTSAETIARTIGAALSKTEQANLVKDIGQFGITVSSRLPRNVAVLLRENAGFSLIHLARPQIVLQVSERLLSAALTQYLHS